MVWLSHSNTVHPPSITNITSLSLYTSWSLCLSFSQAMAYSQTRSLRRRRTEASKPIYQSPLKPHSEPQIDDDDDYSYTVCEECGSGDAADKLLLCDKCDRGFHLFCLRPIIVSVPKGRWFCPSCSSQKKLKRTLIVIWHFSVFDRLVIFLFNLHLSFFPFLVRLYFVSRVLGFVVLIWEVMRKCG